MKNMKRGYRNAYRIYVVLCMGVGVFLQYGNPRPQYFMGGFYGLIGSWIGPGIVAKGLTNLFSMGEIGVPVMLGISAAFWLLFFKLAKSSPAQRPGRGRQAGGGIVVADPSRFDVLPNLPPGYSYYNRPEQHTTRITYVDEERL